MYTVYDKGSDRIHDCKHSMYIVSVNKHSSFKLKGVVHWLDTVAHPFQWISTKNVQKSNQYKF